MGSLLGKNLNKVVPVKARQLSSKVEPIRTAYIDRLEKLFRQRNIYCQLLRLEKKASFPATQEVKNTLEELDRLIVELMKISERKCRNICAAHYEFSPVIKEWLDRCHAFRQLLRLRLDIKVGNSANIKRFVRRCGLQQEIRLPTETLYKRNAECKEHTKRYMADSPWMGKQFLTDKLLAAIE